MTEEVTEKKKNGWGGKRANTGGARPNSGGARPGAGAKPGTGAGGVRPGAGRKPVDPEVAKNVILNLLVPMSMKIYVQENGGAGFVRALIEAHQRGELKV